MYIYIYIQLYLIIFSRMFISFIKGIASSSEKEFPHSCDDFAAEWPDNVSAHHEAECKGLHHENTTDGPL